ncbi:MAG: tRNA (adenosine(37)-N6)-threonylcarbamoyltransferase complex dimerization subunit type 1 TsaB [Betaproteobacteria bacterium]|nr:tRNA (adenosine(37)-N6)-threonylcarbamoyltransferase complex dimerization subunit type 1 TsaB [Betaproteobacteria bacterium]
MKLIALETSTHHLSIALWLDGVLIERDGDIPNGGSERLLPWLNELLTDAGMTFSQFDGIAFGAGPGGFTGLRLACGVAQGLAFGLDLPVVGVSSLEALALAAYSGGTERIFASLDARMNEVYFAAYQIRDGASETVQAPAVAVPQSVLAPQAWDGIDWIGCGNGFVAYPEMLKTAAHELRADCWPTAAAVARLAAPRLARGEGVDAGLAAPLYVRDKVALTTAERYARGGLK